MKIKNVIWKTAVALMILPCCTACDDDESMTIESKYYIGTEVDPSDSYSISVVINKTDNVATVNMQSKYNFIVRSTLPALTDVQINVEPDETLIETYNKANGTAYALLPATNYSFTTKAIIKAGSYASADSISVVLMKPETLVRDDGYLLPLRLSSFEGGNDGRISANRSVVYIKVDVSLYYPGNLLFKGIEPFNDLTDMKRAEFEIECSAPAYDESYDVKYLLDGDYSSVFFRAANGATPIKIDMRSMHTPKGVSIAAGYGYYAYSSYALKTFQISVSKDGKKWVGYGDVTINQPIKDASSASKPFVQYIEFKQILETRYIQMQPLSAYGSYINLSEINIYE